MSVQESFVPAPPPSSITPAQERAPSPSSSLGDAPTIDPSPRKKTTKKKKAPKKRVAKKTKQAEPVDAPPPQPARSRYEPYRRTEPTPEPEGDLPADPEQLETLDATAKMLYKSDREVLEYIESLKHRTAAMLEHVNRTGSQLRSSRGAMERIRLFVGQRKKVDDHWSHPQRFGNGSEMEVPDSEEEDNTPNPALTRNENGAFSAAGEHLSKYIQFGSPSRRTPAHTFLGNINHPNFPYDYVHDVLGKSAPSPDNDDGEEDFSRPETPPARQPSLPPDHEDANGLEYAEDEIEMRSDFPAPPGHAALASDDSTFDCSGVDLRIASDTEILFPRSDEELARISKEFKREVMDSTVALAMQPPVNILRPRHPLAQSNVLPSPDPVPGPELQHLVIPHPVPRTPSPSRTIPGGKRKRVLTPEDEQEGYDTGNIAGPSTIAAHPNGYVPRQVVTRNNEDRVSPKRRRLITRQQTWDLQMVAEAGYVPAHLDVDPPTRESPPESSQPAHRQTSPPPIATSQIQKEDSELEKSQVIEMLSQNVEQGESEDEESTRNILRGLGGSQRILPALTPDNTQPASADDSQSETETPAESQIPARVPSPIPEDVFGPIVLSAKANKISDRFPAKVSKNTDGDIIMSDPEHETANTSSKSTRFNFDESEKEGKVFRKTPFRPRTSSRVMEIRNLLVAEVEAENKDTLKPLPSPKKKKRAVGLRARKPSPTPSIEAEPTIGPEGGLPSVSASKPPSRLRRGRSASVQPEVPALPKTPVKRSTRGRK